MLTCDPRTFPENLTPEYLKDNLSKVMDSLTYKFQDKSGYQIRPEIIAFDTET